MFRQKNIQNQKKEDTSLFVRPMYQNSVNLRTRGPEIWGALHEKSKKNKNYIKMKCKYKDRKNITYITLVQAKKKCLSPPSELSDGPELLS